MDIIDIVNIIKINFSDKWMIEEDHKYLNDICKNVILQFKTRNYSDDNILIEINLSNNDKDTFEIDVANNRFMLNTGSEKYEEQIFLLNNYISNIIEYHKITKLNKEIHRAFDKFELSSYVVSIIREYRIDKSLK